MDAPEGECQASLRAVSCEVLLCKPSELSRKLLDSALRHVV